ncbi:MAG: HU family DNA-binding protein [Dissulfurimicrobium sp.]|uniref:HU family DNA-binding protein n=1 Tax=Dissulfurimicrobium sp. TaxID=2022436 RepID=UPI004049C207
MASDVLLKGDIVARLKVHFPEMLKKDLNDMVDTVFDSICEALKDGRRVEIRGFGSLSIHQQKGRNFINPRNNLLTSCPANKRIVFKPGKALSWQIDD